ncbi:DUF4179 domain-containing protein [Paenibacillus tyrfis]|uniref:DUF4179 domain-containing protein n=1 Tax=Paenibacillus tyrfis TaxID=1501230 RepID=UPI000B58EFB3|nr:DUF4179 domain-containing protein [Paenibacillus tyrfis]
MTNKVTEEIESIEIPRELRERGKLGIEQARRELGLRTWRSKLAKTAVIAAASAGLIVALGAATSPTFASYVKSLFTFYNVDEGLKKAADEGFAEPVNREVTDQGITLKVKEVVNDVFRLSIVYGLEKDGKPLDTDLLFENFTPTDPEQDPYVNEYTFTDENGKELNLSRHWQKVGNDRMLYLSLDDVAPGKEVKSLTDLPNKLFIDFNINQIGETAGKWHLNVPVDLSKAKASAAVIPLNKRYESPFGFSLDFLQLRHGPSKSEMLVQVNETQKWKRSYQVDPSFRYQIKDGQGRVIAAEDFLPLHDLAIGSKNAIPQFAIGQGTSGKMRYWHAFLPFQEAKDLKLELTTVYTVERMAKDFSVSFDPKEVMKQPLTKETEGNKLSFTARMKTEEAKERLSDGREVFQGKGWVIEADQQLGADTLDLKWALKDGQGREMTPGQQVALLSQDEQGHYRNRTLFFFQDGAAVPDRVTMTYNRYTKANPVSWSIPLEPSSDPALPEVPKVYDMTIEDLNKPEIVAKAEKAVRELVPGEPVEMYGVTELADRWFLHLKGEDAGMAIVDKAAGEPFILRRHYAYDKLDGALRQKAEQAMRELDSGQNRWFERGERLKMKDHNEWIISGERAEVVIDAVTGAVTKAALKYSPKEVNAQPPGKHTQRCRTARRCA